MNMNENVALLFENCDARGEIEVRLRRIERPKQQQEERG